MKSWLLSSDSNNGNRRYQIAWMTCLALVCVLAMRCEMGMAIIKLTQSVNEFKLVTNRSVHEAHYELVKFRQLKWDNNRIGVIEAGFFMGYMLASIPGGSLINIIQPSNMLGYSVITTCLLNMLIPLAVHVIHGFYLVMILRIFQGMAEACVSPSIHALWRYWAPLQERSKLISISFLGMAAGPIIGYPLSGLLIEISHWSTPFYVFGILGSLWSLYWLYFMPSTPWTDERISAQELQYIEQNIIHTDTPSWNGIPWLAIFTSLPVWAIVAANSGRNWIYQFSLSGLPAYYEDVYNTNEEDIGFAMMLPYVAMAATTPLGGCLSDALYTKVGMSTIKVRRILNTFGFTAAGIALLSLAYVRVVWLSTILLCVMLGAIGFGINGYGVNHLDIAPQHAGLLMGMSNGIGTISGILSPIIAHKLIIDHGSKTNWKTFFIISAILQFISVAIFFIFASADLQMWANHNAVQSKQNTINTNSNLTIEEQENLANTAISYNEKQPILE